jgi:hypothetical protein
MKLYLEWGRPIPLKDGSRENYIYLPDQDRLPEVAGVYVFGRRRKNGGFEALYIGRANNIRARVWGHRKNLPLMMHLKNAKGGERVVRVGIFNARQAQKVKKCLPLIERALIRYFLSEGHDLVNKAGARLGRHELVSDGKHPNLFIPKLMYTQTH